MLIREVGGGRLGLFLSGGGFVSVSVRICSSYGPGEEAVRQLAGMGLC